MTEPDHFGESEEKSAWPVCRRNLCTHITALKIFRKILFIAEGNQISLFNLFSKKIVDYEVVFSCSSIHGIKINDHLKIIFFGSKSVRVYSFDSASAKCLTSVSSEILLHDWIHDVEWLIPSDSSCSEIIVISAHNSMTVLNINDKRKLQIIQCAENCILYSASIISALENVVVVAVGTVFKQILLWSPNSPSEVKGAKVPFHCLEGHQGVIFSVTYSKTHSLLSSTSDDRSVRLWKICSMSNDDSALEFWENSSISLSHILYAHESRVWTSSILDCCILSVGEDSCICFWDMNGQLLKRKKCHRGGSVWCLETNCSVDKRETGVFNDYIAITGGSDGGVYCWEVQNTLPVDLIHQISLHPSTEKDFPRVVSVIHCYHNQKCGNQLMATTDRGWLSIYDMDLTCWKDIYQDVSFASYCILSVSNRNIIALGNLNGDLVLLNTDEKNSCENNVKKFNIHNGKIFALHWVDKNSESLLSCAAEGNMILWSVSDQNSEFYINKIHQFHLPKCKPHWWSTAAVYVAPSNHMIVGDRGGSINFYSLPSNTDQRLEPCLIHKAIHGENGVTDIQEHQSLIYSAGRDGRVLLYCIDKGSLCLLHAIKISHDLEWIGKMLFYGSDLLLLGFHTKYFIVWSTELESTIMTVECGGGHRSWDFYLTNEGQATFAAIKKKDIIFTTENLYFTLNKSIIKAGVSGREFCQTCYLFTVDYNCSNSMAVLAAGGEDNSLQIIGFLNILQILDFLNNDRVEHSQIKCLYRLSGHLSSIRSLAKTDMPEENAYLLASVGGRAQMMLWKIKKESRVTCEQLASYILSSSEKKTKKPWKESQSIQFDPQTRIMDVTLSLNKENECGGENYIVALACSDSYFRVYNFDATKKLLSLYYNVQLGEHCLLRLANIHCTEDIYRGMYFAIASTNGNLNIKNHTDMKSLNISQIIDSDTNLQNSSFQVKLHQSGINALDVKHISGYTWLICAGGDDNAISAVIVEIRPFLTDENYFKILARTHVPNAHASQITGLKCVGLKTLISASVDQRVNLWKWKYDSESLDITLEASKMSSIPDIADLECWEHGSNMWITVCGEGIERFSVGREI